MRVGTFLAIYAILAALFGVGFVSAPNEVLSIYGFPASPYVATIARLFGGTLLGLAAIQWFARDLRGEGGLTSLLIGLGMSHLVNFLIAVSATLDGTINPMGWTTVLIYFAGTAGCVYFLKHRDETINPTTVGKADN